MQKTSLICNNFSGINRTSSIYSSSVITASDIQNVELFATGVNLGVGIRTAKGNISVYDDIPEGEKVINIFKDKFKINTIKNNDIEAFITYKKCPKYLFTCTTIQVYCKK